jgi:hypothetical protein
MMHPDQMYQLRQLRHHDLRMETDQARAAHELAAKRAAWGSPWLAVWLRGLSARWARGFMFLGVPEATHPAGRSE